MSGPGSGNTPVAWLVEWRDNPGAAWTKEKRPRPPPKRFGTRAAAEAYKAQIQNDDIVVCITPVLGKAKTTQEALLDGDFCRDWQMKS
jgi:hypothetical protein